LDTLEEDHVCAQAMDGKPTPKPDTIQIAEK